MTHLTIYIALDEKGKEIKPARVPMKWHADARVQELEREREQLKRELADLRSDVAARVKVNLSLRRDLEIADKQNTRLVDRAMGAEQRAVEMERLYGVATREVRYLEEKARILENDRDLLLSEVRHLKRTKPETPPADVTKARGVLGEIVSAFNEADTPTGDQANRFIDHRGRLI